MAGKAAAVQMIDIPEQEGEAPEDAVSLHPAAERGHLLRVVEALVFASAEPVSEDALRKCLPGGTDVKSLLAELKETYAARGVTLVQVSGKWTFRTADDLAYLLRREAQERRRLSKAALETLAIVAYHQPVTRAEIEDIRGVAISKGTLDQLLEMGWVRLRGRRKTPGRPVTYGTTEEFLAHFGLNEVTDLPGMAELKGAGLLDANLPPDFSVPLPSNEQGLLPDEDPLEDGEEQMALEMDQPDPEAGEEEALPPEPEDEEPDELPPLSDEERG